MSNDSVPLQEQYNENIPFLPYRPGAGQVTTVKAVHAVVPASRATTPQSVRRVVWNLAACSNLAPPAAGLALPSCQDDFDAPQIDVPQASITANTTIAELKSLFWDEATNYAKEIRDETPTGQFLRNLRTSMHRLPARSLQSRRSMLLCYSADGSGQQPGYI